MSRFSFFSFLFCLAPWAASAAPQVALPKPVLPVWIPAFEDQPSEARWSFRATPRNISSGEARLFFGWKNTGNHAVLRILPRQIALWQIQDGAAKQIASAQMAPNSELIFQKTGDRVRVLLSGKIVLQKVMTSAGEQAAWMQKGGMNFQTGAFQSTENPVFRDDFMREGETGAAQIPSDWKTTGQWKTSGTLGPKSNAALNPNPFVFRALSQENVQREKKSRGQGKGEGDESAVARAGKWWWSDYAVSAAFRSLESEPRAPIVVVLGAYGNRVRAEFDVQNGESRLWIGAQLAAKTAFSGDGNDWHRVRLEPGPGRARVFFDGREILAAPADFASGEITLGARLGGGNFVDFDDVRVGQPGGSSFGEASFNEALPSRFKTDRLISFWASDARSWKRVANGAFVHNGDFWGDARVEFALPVWKTGGGATFSRGSQKLVLLRTPSGIAVSSSTQTKVLKLRAGQMLEVGFEKMSVTLKGLGKTIFTASTERAQSTKIAILPTQNGAALPLPELKSVILNVPTFERGGRSRLGINISNVTSLTQKEEGLTDARGVAIDNFESDSTAPGAGVLVGDIVRRVNDQPVADVNAIRALVGALDPGQIVKLEVLRPFREVGGFHWDEVRARTSQVLDYAFTTAPTDWRVGSGVWDLTERWTCSPQWSFFGGKNAVAPTLWSRFQTRGDWTLEAFLATPMDLTRGERSPSDLNITVCGDGARLGSGLSFLFAGEKRTQNQVRRDGSLLWKAPFQTLPGAGETHQDWFYVRIEKRGARFRWSVNGRELAQVSDPHATSGQIAFWTQNGGLSIARVRLWHAGIEAAPAFAAPQMAPQTPIDNPLGRFSTRNSAQFASARMALAPRELHGSQNASEAKRAIQITNPHDGGDWTLFLTRSPFDVAQKPVVSFDYKITPDVKINLYALVGGIWREIQWSGPRQTGSENSHFLGAMAAVTDGKWATARVNLQLLLEEAGLAGQRVESLALSAPAADYLRAGLGGNARGATYFLRDLRVE